MPLMYMLTDWLLVDPAAHGTIIAGIAVMIVATMLWLLAPPAEEGGRWVGWVFAIGAVLTVGGCLVSDYMRYYYFYY